MDTEAQEETENVQCHGATEWPSHGPGSSSPACLHCKQLWPRPRVGPVQPLPLGPWVRVP